MDMSTDEKSKDAPNQSEAIGRSSSERPPPYSANEVEQPPLELPQLDLSSNLSDSTTITRDQCVAHLKFLAVLADLRDTISSDDGLVFAKSAGRYIQRVQLTDIPSGGLRGSPDQGQWQLLMTWSPSTMKTSLIVVLLLHGARKTYPRWVSALMPR